MSPGLGLRRFVAVDTSSMPDAGNLNPLCFVVDSIEHAIVAAAQAPQAAQLSNEGFAGPRLRRKSDERRDYRGMNLLGKPAHRLAHLRTDNDLVQLRHASRGRP